MTNLPVTAQLSTLSQEIGALTAKLAPAESSSIASYLLSMRKAGMALTQGMKPEDLETVYGYALSDVPAVGLKRAVEKIIKGEYDIEHGFIPRPPELAAMARAEAKAIRDDLARLREKERTLRDLQGQPAPVSEEARARVRSILKKFRAGHEAYRAEQRGNVVHEPMSEDKAEYWRKIEGLKDARHVDAEHLTFRRKIEMDMPEQRREAAE